MPSAHADASTPSTDGVLPGAVRPFEGKGLVSRESQIMAALAPDKPGKTLFRQSTRMIGQPARLTTALFFPLT